MKLKINQKFYLGILFIAIGIEGCGGDNAGCSITWKTDDESSALGTYSISGTVTLPAATISGDTVEPLAIRNNSGSFLGIGGGPNGRDSDPVSIPAGCTTINYTWNNLAAILIEWSLRCIDRPFSTMDIIMELSLLPSRV